MWRLFSVMTYIEPCNVLHIQVGRGFTNKRAILTYPYPSLEERLVTLSSVKHFLLGIPLPRVEIGDGGGALPVMEC
jgi:hypothetical protein